MGGGGGGSKPDPKIRQGQAVSSWTDYQQYRADALETYEREAAAARASAGAAGGGSADAALQAAEDKYRAALDAADSGAASSYARDYYKEQRKEIEDRKYFSLSRPDRQVDQQQRNRKDFEEKQAADLAAFDAQGIEGFYASLGYDGPAMTSSDDAVAAATEEAKGKNRFGGQVNPERQSYKPAWTVAQNAGSMQKSPWM